MKRHETSTTIKLQKVCPKCNTQYPADSDLSCCPTDQALLAPMSNMMISSIVDDRYEILRLLGAGASSEVFLARNKRLNNTVALKVLHLTMVSDPAKVVRFQEEAKSVTKLKHDSIAEVHDYGLTADGRPYMVMDYVNGQSLADTLSKGKIEEELACSYLIQLCDALQTAHNQGIVHRDIKPANIMFEAKKADSECCRLLDFGVARTILDDRQSDVTKTGDVMGTPAYMSPEQCLGQVVDGRSDVYSLGCVFYEMITGERLVKAENQFDCMDWHLNKKAPNYQAPTATSRDINLVLQKMLAKDAEDRYQEMSAVKADLEKILNCIPLLEPKKPNNRIWQAVAAAAAAILICFLVAVLQQHPTAPIVPAPPTAQHTAKLAALKEMRAWMVLPTANGTPDGNPKLFECNGLGPIKGGQRIPAPQGTTSTAYSPDLNSVFCATPDSIYKFSLSSNSIETEVLRSHQEVTLRGLECLSYDTKRKRLYVFGEGPQDEDFLFTYDPYVQSSFSNQAWALIFKPHKVRTDNFREIRGLAYDAEADRSYALIEPSDTATAFIRISPAGKKLETVPLEKQVKELAYGGVHEFYAFRGMGIVFVPAAVNSIENKVYVFDINTGKLLLEQAMRWDN